MRAPVSYICTSSHGPAIYVRTQGYVRSLMHIYEITPLYTALMCSLNTIALAVEKPAATKIHNLKTCERSFGYAMHAYIYDVYHRTDNNTNEHCAE